MKIEIQLNSKQMSSRLLQQTIEEIENELRNGVSQRDIMSNYHVGHATIQMIAQRIDIQASRGRKAKDLTQREIDFAVNYRNYFHTVIIELPKLLVQEELKLPTEECKEFSLK